jgi:GNAT superfamily N-acetyltransferase
VGLGMVVDPAWRGQWVGQALLSALEARAAKLGIDGSGLHQNAAGFYQHCGWQPTGTVDVTGEGSMAILTTTLG